MSRCPIVLFLNDTIFSEGMYNIITRFSTFLRAVNGISRWNNVIICNLPLLLIMGSVVSEGTVKIARSVFWTKFIHDVAMDLSQCLVDMTSLEYIVRYAV